MPATSKKWMGHIGCGLCVHPSIRPFSVHQEPCMLGFWNFIYGFLMEEQLTHICFLVRVVSLSGVMPLWKNPNEIWCMPYLRNRACQGFEISYMDSPWENNWPVFFSCPSCVPFWSYAPLKKIRMKCCQQHISKNIWARGLKLGQLIGDDEKITWLN